MRILLWFLEGKRRHVAPTDTPPVNAITLAGL